MNKTEIRAAISLAAVYVLRMLGLFMVMPVLAVVAHDYADYSPLLLGLAIGGYGLTQALLQIPMGILSDRWGRKVIIISGLILFALGSLLAANADSLLGVVVGRFLQGTGAIAGAIMALAGDVSRESQRSKVMAIIGIAIGFSFYVALLIGPLIAEYGGIRGIFAVTAILATLCIPLVWLVVPNASNLAPSGDTLPVIKDIKTLFFDPQLRRLNMSVLLLHMLITLLFVQVPSLLSKQSWPLKDHWQLYLPVLILSIVSMAGLMMLARKQGQTKIIKLSVLLLACAFAGLFLGAQHFFILALMVWLFFSAFNFLEANFPAMVSSIAPAGKKGSAMGIYASSQFFGAFSGGVLGGSLSSVFGAQGVFLFAAVICLIWLYLVSGLIGKEHLKRYTLGVDFKVHSTEKVGKLLINIEGVEDITIIPDENTVYLKVDSSKFQLSQAKQALNLE